MSDLGLPSLGNGSILTLGTFDGVHLGHQEILRDLAERGRRHKLRPIVVTFAPHPLAVLNPAAAPRLLTSTVERLVAIADSAAVECAVVIPFTREVAALTPEQFVRLLIDRYRMKELIVGYDHGLGRGRQGDVNALRAIGTRLGFDVHVIEAQTDSHGIAISSTAIRRAVAYGDLAAARSMLGRRYSFVGVVERGSSRGRSIGVPTLNVATETDKLLPPDGVYSVKVASRLGAFGGMMNLGGRPTFGETARVPEIHLFDASGDWYGETVAVEFVSRLRDTVRFAGVTELVAQLSRDAEQARVALTQA